MVVCLTAYAEVGTPPLVPLVPEHVQEHLEKALDALVMTKADARFEKDHGKPGWALSWITNTLADPWALPGYAETIFTTTDSRESAPLWGLASRLMETGESARGAPAPPSEPPDSAGWSGRSAHAWMNEDLERALHSFLQQANAASSLLEEAFSELSPDERTYLAASLLVSTFEAEDNAENRTVLIEAGIPREVQEHVDQNARKLDGTADALAWLALAQKVDRARLQRAGQLFQEAVAQLARSAREVEVWPDEVVEIDTDPGRIVIGTRGSDQFSGPALLVVDPGGDDHYLDGPGTANGLLGQPLSAVIDLGGSDRYASRGLLGVGAALWGISVVYEVGGDDDYRADYVGLGATLFGVAWHEDFSGDDRYRSHAIGQGAGWVGFGWLIDHAGDDSYDIGFYGQGFAGVMGWGMLLDRAGHDRYFAGNRRRDHERNDDRFLSLSQGFSIGMRPHAGGGVGALIDRSGNDTYIADIYGQGVSYYYSAGFLLDGAGNDRYAMYQYGQGCGIHLSLGLLADASGNDFYTGYILAQGAAHDYAVGMLFDHAGDDTYTADHHAQGRALNNAFALLVDRSGNDAYFGRQRDGVQGIGNSGGFRDYGSLALLLDLEGEDRYSGGFSNQTITLRPLYGVVYDYSAEVENE